MDPEYIISEIDPRSCVHAAKIVPEDPRQATSLAVQSRLDVSRPLPAFASFRRPPPWQHGRPPPIPKELHPMPRLPCPPPAGRRFAARPHGGGHEQERESHDGECRTYEAHEPKRRIRVGRSVANSGASRRHPHARGACRQAQGSRLRM